MEFLDFQLDLLQIPEGLKATLGTEYSYLGNLVTGMDVQNIPEVWKFGVANLDKALNEFGLKLGMDAGSWVAPKERKVRPVSAEDVSKILEVGICRDENVIRSALSITSSVNNAVRWLIENEELEKLRLEVLRKNQEPKNHGDVERPWNPGHGIISEGSQNVKFLRREGSSQPKRTFWLPEQRYRSVLSSDDPEVPKEGVRAPCEHQPPSEVQREGRSREESESGEDVELVSAPNVPVREGLGGSDYSSEKEEDFGMHVQAIVTDPVEEKVGEPEQDFGVIGERKKSDSAEGKEEVGEDEPKEATESVDPLIPSQPPQPMKSLLSHNSQPHSYFSRSPGHGTPWALNAQQRHHMEDPKPVCSFNLRPKFKSTAHLSRVQRMQHMEYLRMQQQRRRAMENGVNYGCNPCYSQALRGELFRESEAMVIEEMRRQEAMRHFEMGPGFERTFDKRRYEPDWEGRMGPMKEVAQLTRPTGREYYAMHKQDPVSAHLHFHSYNCAPQMAKDSDEVRAFGRQTILENLDFSDPHAPPDPSSNRAENFVYFPDEAIRTKPSFSKAPGEPVHAWSDGCYIMTPSPPPTTQHSIHAHRGIFKQHRESQDSNQKTFNAESRSLAFDTHPLNLFEDTTRPNSKSWHPFVSGKPEKSKLTHSESPGRSSSPTISESKPCKSASSDKLNMQTFIKSLSAAKLPKKEEPLNNDQLSFWQKLVKTTKKNERENVQNFFKMFKNSSPNPTGIHESEDLDDEFNHELDLMKELAFLNAETSSNKSATSDDDPTRAFFKSLLERSNERILSTTNNESESDEDFEIDNKDETSEIAGESDESEEPKTQSPVSRENLEPVEGPPNFGPPNYLELYPPPPDTMNEVAPEQNELKVNDEEFLASLEALKRGSCQKRKQQTDPEVEINEDLYRRLIENLLHQHDEAKLKYLDILFAQHIDSHYLYVQLCELYRHDSNDVEPLNKSTPPKLWNEEPPPLLNEAQSSGKPSTPFETAI